MITLTVLVIFVVASLLFGVLWSKYRFDMQGAFGVSAYMMACCAVLVPFAVTRVDVLG
jgi:hypothetical protein